MPHFSRTRPLPVTFRHYASYRSYVRADFRETCAYCLLKEVFAAGLENFEIDHFRPQSRYSVGVNDFYNLYWACHPCNHIKAAKVPLPELQARGIWFVDLCASDFAQHYREHADGSWEPLTDDAMYTEKALLLNRPHLKQVRQLLARLGASETRDPEAAE
jgi:hypothetical protein